MGRAIRSPDLAGRGGLGWEWPAETAPAGADELILPCVPDQGFPVITNVAFGHAGRKIQLPLGCRVEFDLSGGRQVLRYLEDLVAV